MTGIETDITHKTILLLIIHPNGIMVQLKEQCPKNVGNPSSRLFCPATE